MKMLLSLIVVFISIASCVKAQWVNQGAWPNENLKGGIGLSGLAVDPDGKVWIQPFSATDTIMTGNGVVPTRVIYCFNADGTPAPFSPIKTFEYPSGMVDSILGNSGRGLRASADGNIIASQGYWLVKIDYQTGQALSKIEPFIGLGPTGLSLVPCQVGISDNGEVFVSAVNGTYPLKRFDSNLNFIDNAVATVNDFGRTLLVSGDGLTIYNTRFTAPYVEKYVRQNQLSPFLPAGTFFEGLAIESTAWDNMGNIWLSAGSYLTQPYSAIYSPNTWYAFNPHYEVLVDSLKWEFNTPLSPDERPRGLAFSPDGRYAYIGCSGSSAYPMVQRLYNPSINYILEAPSNLVAVSTSSKNVRLSWRSNSISEMDFVVERKDGDTMSLAPYMVIASLLMNATTFVDTSVVDTTLYSYRVKAMKEQVSSGYSNQAQVLTPVSVESEDIVKMPLLYDLGQNYPNPFNPETSIRFEIPQHSNVRLIIFNSLGEAVQILADGFFEAGSYKVMFNATGLPGGIYFYQLQAGGFTDVKKCVVLK